MSTIARAIALLDLITPETPEIGLSEVTRRTGRDKATCFRHLEALQGAGLLEQNPVTRKYRMGPVVLRWAGLREAAVPRRAAVEPALAALSVATGELAHASLLDDTRLMALAHHDAGVHATRAVIDITELPLNATASGLSVLAFARPGLLAAVEGEFVRHTDRTPKDLAELEPLLEKVRATGFGTSIESFEIGVHGTSVPVFDGSGHAAGAIAVAAVASRMTPELETAIKTNLVTAARTVTAQWGGVVPPGLQTLWNSYLAQCEPASSDRKETT